MSGKDRDNIKIHEAEEFYVSFLQYTQSVFADIVNIGVLNIDFIAKKIKILWDEVQHNCRFLLYAHTCIEPVSGEDYLISHSVRSTVIAIIIGKYLKLPNHRLMELGIAALLHDIGMLKLSPETYLKRSDLKEWEKNLIYTHPMHGYIMLQPLKCPPAVSLAVLEHHEQENGLGYPNKLKGESISLYGKIIAVASSYEALTAKRLYKKAKDNHTGIVELLKNEKNQYNRHVVKALIDTLSIYPIGMFVLLSNGKQGRVFEINPSNQHYPAVQLLEHEDKKEGTVIWTSDKGIYIARPLTDDEFKQ